MTIIVLTDDNNSKNVINIMADKGYCTSIYNADLS